VALEQVSLRPLNLPDGSQRLFARRTVLLRQVCVTAFRPPR
jgi:hypothetical protein